MFNIFKKKQPEKVEEKNSVAKEAARFALVTKEEEVAKEFFSIKKSHLSFLHGGGTRMIFFEIDSNQYLFLKALDEYLKSHLPNFSFVERSKKFLVFDKNCTLKDFCDPNFEFSEIFSSIREASLKGKNSLELKYQEIEKYDLLIPLLNELDFSHGFPNLNMSLYTISW